MVITSMFPKTMITLIDAARYYILAVLLGKVMKPRKASKSDLGVY